MTKILVIDDEEMIRFAFEQFLLDEGYVPLLAWDAPTALEALQSHDPAIIFLDFRLPGRDGLDLLSEIRRTYAKTAVVFMTAFGVMDIAIKAMQLGAYDYLTKPLDLDAIRILIRRILDAKQSSAEREVGTDSLGQEASTEHIIGKSGVMQEIFKMIGLLTTKDVTVLITGESGVGKELVAQAIHKNSPRKGFPFVAVNCGAMPENLLEAEMFGYEKGAFTGADAQKKGKFEFAQSGTIFLDEIGELKPSLQVKLLRVLQERTFERVGGNVPIATDARIIAATNKDLLREVTVGSFRKDLFYRLHLIHVHIPPLRERKEDIPPLIEHFIRKANHEMGRQVKGVTDEAMRHLMMFTWPGNARELENMIKRAMVLSREDVLPEYLFAFDPVHKDINEITAQERLSLAVRQCLKQGRNDCGGSVFDAIIGMVEKTLIEQALRDSQNNQAQAAKELGMHRSTLRKKINDYHIL